MSPRMRENFACIDTLTRLGLDGRALGTGVHSRGK